ncbi:hypothetical protein [Pseudomonas putida]|uniref:hypothetical protein n=1 Tax=Pseudomonas putida TaxID=303 RepID=UPI00119822C0|nr:hypothetical protein [Pseudomonas putida]
MHSSYSFRDFLMKDWKISSLRSADFPASYFSPSRSGNPLFQRSPSIPGDETFRQFVGQRPFLLSERHQAVVCCRAE